MGEEKKWTSGWDDEWEGLKFVIITPDMFPAAMDFMWEHFFPDEPISRSIGLTRHWSVDEYHMLESMKDQSSIAALDKEGKIVGCRLGNRKRYSWFNWKLDKITISVLLRFWPQFSPGPAIQRLDVGLKLIRKIGYDPYPLFAEKGCQMMYEDKAVCAARVAGVRGLGTEITRRSELLAKELGCTGTYALVTGKYSRRIFEKLGHTIINEIKYADYKDEQGEPYLKDTREHESLIICWKDL